MTVGGAGSIKSQPLWWVLRHLGKTDDVRLSSELHRRVGAKLHRCILAKLDYNATLADDTAQQL